MIYILYYDYLLTLFSNHIKQIATMQEYSKSDITIFMKLLKPITTYETYKGKDKKLSSVCFCRK